MKHSRILLCLLASVSLGCQREESASVIPPAIPEASFKPVHESERIALGFISDAMAGRFADAPVDFPADFQLAANERVVAFRMLERYINSTSWQPHYTAITIVDGREDAADIYYRGSDDKWLLLMSAFHYDTNDWQLDAYEIPERAFARPETETFPAYMARGVAESRATAKPYQSGVTADGTYYIAH